MRISTALTIALVLIGTIGAAGLANETLRAWRNFEMVQQLRNLIVTRGKWYDALITLSVERSFSQVLLASPETGFEAIADMRAQQMQKSDEKLAAARESIAVAGAFPIRDELLGDIAPAMEEIAILRRRIDALLAQPLEARDEVLVDEVITELKDAIIAMRGLAVHMVTPNDLTGTQSILLSRLQDLAFDVREYGGRARSHYAIATLHGEALSPLEAQYADSVLHRAKDAWHEIEHIVETVEIPAVVMSQLEVVQKSFNQDYVQLLAKLDAEMAAATANMPADTAASADPEAISVTYSVPFDSYFEQSGDALESASVLSQVTGTALDQIWDDNAAKQQSVMIWDIAAVLGLLGLVGSTLWVVSSKITRRLNSSLAELTALTAGNLDVAMTRKTGDLFEIKALSHGLDQLQEQLQMAAKAREELGQSEHTQKAVVSSLSNALISLAAGNLSTRITDKFDQKYQGLADNFNNAASGLSDLVARVIETASTILSGARGINQATTDLSHRTETQGMTLQKAAAALEELTRNIIGSQSDTTELDGLAGQATQKSVAMRVKMGQTVEAIEKIKSSSQQIEQIVGVIEDIAFQTNLLALNAGVEATRAGAEGSGFAVIASEVRGLAERSSQSAQDIKNLIAVSGVEVSKGVEYVAAAESAVSDIGDQFAQISALISRIANAATEQSQGLTKVNDGVSQLDLVTQTNVAMVEETTAECASLTSVAQDLAQLVSRFQISQRSAFATKDQGGPVAWVA